MKLIIDIDEQHFELLQMAVMNGMGDNAQKIIAQGTPIPDNATNGNSVIKTFCHGIVRISSRKNVSVEFNKDWWNSPYQKGGKE